MNCSRRTAIAAASSVLLAWRPSMAQGNWPQRQIHLIVPLAAGSAVDNAARLVMQKVGEGIGQPFVVENLPGSAGLIGAEKVARAAPDGYTLGAFNDSILTMVPNLYANMTWNALKDFDPVSLIGTIEWGLVVKSDSPYRSLADFIAAAKAAPGKLTYGSGGVGSPQHIGMALLSKRADLSLLHVPYKGATPAAVAAAAGEVDVSMQGLGTAASLLQAGKLRLLAVATPKRLAEFSDIPTFEQAGLPGFTFNSWCALVAPAGTPRSVVTRLDKEIAEVLADPAVVGQLTRLGVTPRGLPAEEFGKALKVQYALYEKVIREQGIKAD